MSTAPDYATVILQSSIFILIMHCANDSAAVVSRSQPYKEGRQSFLQLQHLAKIVLVLAKNRSGHGPCSGNPCPLRVPYTHSVECTAASPTTFYPGNNPSFGPLNMSPPQDCPQPVPSLYIGNNAWDSESLT